MNNEIYKNVNDYKINIIKADDDEKETKNLNTNKLYIHFNAPKVKRKLSKNSCQDVSDSSNYDKRSVNEISRHKNRGNPKKFIKMKTLNLYNLDGENVEKTKISQNNPLLNSTKNMLLGDNRKSLDKENEVFNVMK